MARTRWIDEDGDDVLIDDYAKEMDQFVDAFADGKIDDSELSGMESRLKKSLEEVDGMLSDEQHAAVTKLLCELTAYTIMDYTHTLQAARPKTKFRG